MPVRIRLARHGRKSRPYYYIVAADSRAPRDGKFIERIGSYNPMTNPASINLDFDKALSWIQKGAQPSDTARAILKDQGVLYKNHLIKGVKKGALTDEQVEEKFQAWLKDSEDRVAGIVKKLDDAVSADKKSRMDAEVKIREAMATMIPNTTKIIIAQRIDSIKDADRVLVMENGHVGAFDSHDNLLKTSKAYKEVFESQTKSVGGVE